jgi:hypothetical protein
MLPLHNSDLEQMKMQTEQYIPIKRFNMSPKKYRAASPNNQSLETIFYPTESPVALLTSSRFRIQTPMRVKSITSLKIYPEKSSAIPKLLHPLDMPQIQAKTI